MGRIVWPPSALEDIEAIADYIAEESSDSAAKFIEKIMQ